MAKIALIADTHFGVRNDSKQLLNNQKKFFQEIFFPYIDKYKIKTVIHLGDVFDRRKYVNFSTAFATRDILFEPLIAREIETHILLGNHDVFYKETNAVNSMKELYGNEQGEYYGGMKVYENPEIVNIAGKSMLMLPWICAANEGMTYDLIKTANASLAFGHLELFGFPMYSDTISDHGMDHRLFANYDMVYSGHFHHKSITGNIHYLGSTGQYTWSDYEDSRGFHILDTETGEIEFISNDFRMFNKYIFDDIKKTPEQMLNFNTSEYAGTFVKMVVRNKQDPYLLEKMIDKFENSDIVNLQVVEEMSMYGLDAEISEEELDESEDTLSILKKVVATAPDLQDNDRTDLETLMTKIYYEAMTRG